MDFICRYLHFHLLACTILISPLWGIDGASSDKLPSPLDKCSPNPCQNRALCRTRGDSYSCFCVPGFQGSHCQINVNECVSQPCENGGTCLDRVGRYSCLCSQGFTGVSCEVNVDECQSEPCLNGGSCHDDVGGFSCTCPPGFHGDQCQINTDECQDGPCQNGALCIDGVNDYRCDCSNTAFTGEHCETPLPACHSEPCFNSAICQDSPGNYSCECWSGFEGHQCEIDVPECASAPCLHGGRCVERSWQALYGSEPLLPVHYDPHRAEGFICSCPNGTTGSLCEEVIDQCDPSPCQNGGTCESFVGGYICHCPKHSPGSVLYGGVNCEERLVGCEGHKCQNHGSCTPFLSDRTHGYTCSCTPGFTGPLCNTPTSFSFERRGYLLLQSPLVETEVSVNVTLSFKTVLPKALLFQRNSRGLLLTLSLQAGRLRLLLTKETSANVELESPSQVLELPHNVTDGQWHSVEATLGNWVLSLKLLDVARSYGMQTYHKVAPVQVLAGPLSPPQNTYIGGVLEDSDSRSPAFIGCMRDVFVDWQLVVPEEWLSNSAVNVSPGCSHRDRCLDAPCQNGGECVNLWQSYQCHCPRPYEGQDCEEEHVTARFGNEDSHSYAAFTITDNITDNLSISLFLRTRKSYGLLLAVANNNSFYFNVWLEDGRVLYQLHSSGVIKAKSVINDGEVHFVNLEMANRQMILYVQGQKQGYMDIRRINIQAGDTVYVGGLSGSEETAVFGGYLKGCVQDLRINDRRLQFFGLDTSVRSYPLQHLDNVTVGCSGDNKCSSNPCLNGGMCFSMWDDFTCSCPPSTSGRHCEEVRWCELAPCPGDADCRMLSEGYECYSNATFLNDSTVLTYRGNGLIVRNITNLSLNMRTRKRNAAILHAENGSSFITLSVQEGYLFLELQSTAGDNMEDKKEDREVSTVSLGSQRTVSDGEWHNVHLFMAAPWTQTSRWTLVLDGEIEEASTSKSRAGNLDFLREGVDIFLGGLAPDAGWSLAGCLSTVQLGGVALPYFTSSDVNLPRLQQDQFALTSHNAPLLGCSGASVCEPNPCSNGGQCQDLFNWFNCTCVGGWAGRRCDLFVDACASDPCRHGNCSVRGLSYECACEFGYVGVDCEEEVDMCENHLCANGGTCLHGPRNYSCLCPDNYTGPFCSERIEEIPWYMIVKTARPKLPVSVCGDNTRNYTCFNGGNCTQRDLSCDCPSGFTGHRCELEVDECKSNPCLNGGYCRNLINKFICVCDMSFAGDICEIDLTTQGLTSSLLLSVSLASVALLLALILASVGLVVALNRRATRGTYSPSRQEKEGSRVEMWSITQPPPMERLI